MEWTRRSRPLDVCAPCFEEERFDLYDDGTIRPAPRPDLVVGRRHVVRDNQTVSGTAFRRAAAPRLQRRPAPGEGGAAGDAFVESVVASGAAAAGGLRRGPSSRCASDYDRWTASVAATLEGGRGRCGETARAQPAAGGAARRKRRRRRRRRRDRTPPSPPRSAKK